MWEKQLAVEHVKRLESCPYTEINFAPGRVVLAHEIEVTGRTTGIVALFLFIEVDHFQTHGDVIRHVVKRGRIQASRAGVELTGIAIGAGGRGDIIIAIIPG